MRLRKKGPRIVAVLVVAGLLAGGWFVFVKPDQKTSPPATQPNKPANSQSGQTQNTANASQPFSGPALETPEFRYQRPEGWAEMSQKALDAAGASSGMGRPTSPAATFTVKVASSTPKDNDELKNATLAELKKFANFELLSSVSTTIDGGSGQKFVYNFSDKNGENKISQEMSVVVNNNKTFFLLFSSTTDDYAKQTGEFKKILDSFQFK